jgi:GNAT superfamily N-acetyltransferase
MNEAEGMDRRGRRPPGYPPEYQRHVKLQNGRQVFIRPVLPSDAGELARAIKTADADTLRRRFLGGPPPVTPALLAHLTRIDYRRRFALVAVDPATGHGVAIARYEPAGDDTAEVAVAVSPAWRHVGLATVLIALLAEAALERGIVTFTASYLAANRPVAALVGRADGHGRQVIEQGIAEFSIALEQHDAAATTNAGPGPAVAPPARAEPGADAEAGAQGTQG